MLHFLVLGWRRLGETESVERSRVGCRCGIQDMSVTRLGQPVKNFNLLWLRKIARGAQRLRACLERPGYVGFSEWSSEWCLSVDSKRLWN